MKETELVITFDDTHDAIEGEAALISAKLPVKVMSLPSSIRAGCGLCLRIPPNTLNAALAALSGIRIGDIYLRTPGNVGSTYDCFRPGKEI